MDKIGIQLASARGLEQKDFIGTIEKIADMGYDGVEFCKCFDTPAKELKKVLSTLGIQSAGSHIAIEKLQHSLKQVIEYSLEINDPYIVIPRLPVHMRDSADAYKRTAELFNIIGQECKDNRIKLAYHHHEYELENYEGETGLDIFCKYTQPDLLCLQLEIYWLEYCGLQPVDTINKYKERCASLHISDVKNREEYIYTELGKGIVDIKGIIAACRKYDVEWYVVEQEKYDIPQLQSFRESLNYLRGIL